MPDLNNSLQGCATLKNHGTTLSNPMQPLVVGWTGFEWLVRSPEGTSFLPDFCCPISVHPLQYFNAQEHLNDVNVFRIYIQPFVLSGAFVIALGMTLAFAGKVSREARGYLEVAMMTTAIASIVCCVASMRALGFEL